MLIVKTYAFYSAEMILKNTTVFWKAVFTQLTCRTRSCPVNTVHFVLSSIHTTASLAVILW